MLKAGDVVALKGELGAGKTTLVKGIAVGLGCAEEDVLSPTFVLINEYQGREKVYHMDWYRLDSLGAQDAALAEECFAARAVSLVEWADRGQDVLPPGAIEIKLEHRGQNRRLIEVTARGDRFGALNKK